VPSIFPARRAPDNLPRPAHWASAAVCKGSDNHPDTWFPIPTDALSVERAKALCRSCPVQMRCRTDALTRGEDYGIWGGLDENQLRAARKVRRAAATVTQTTEDPGALAKAG